MLPLKQRRQQGAQSTGMPDWHPLSWLERRINQPSKGCHVAAAQQDVQVGILRDERAIEGELRGKIFHERKGLLCRPAPHADDLVAVRLCERPEEFWVVTDDPVREFTGHRNPV